MPPSQTHAESVKRETTQARSFAQIRRQRDPDGPSVHPRPACGHRRASTDLGDDETKAVLQRRLQRGHATLAPLLLDCVREARYGACVRERGLRHAARTLLLLALVAPANVDEVVKTQVEALSRLLA